MKITKTGLELTRLYTGDDGESHLETVSLPMKPAKNGLVSDPIPVTGLTVRVWNGGSPIRPNHNSTRRQLIIHLEGEVRVETSQGAKAHLGVGSIVMAENVAPGKGHESHEISQPRLHLILPYAGDPPDVVTVAEIEPGTVAK